MAALLPFVTFLVRDYDEALAWFTDALRFVRVEDTDLGGGKRWLVVRPPGPAAPDATGDSSGTGLLLARATTGEQEAAVGRQAGGRVAFFLATDRFDDDHRHMIGRGVVFREQPRAEPYGRVVVFEDLYGNPWDLLERRIP
jgi:catechol 2,3-dioxygenase-like lactoylglutathione lyase family enzyme